MLPGCRLVSLTCAAEAAAEMVNLVRPKNKRRTGQAVAPPAQAGPSVPQPVDDDDTEQGQPLPPLSDCDVSRIAASLTEKMQPAILAQRHAMSQAHHEATDATVAQDSQFVPQEQAVPGNIGQPPFLQGTGSADTQLGGLPVEAFHLPNATGRGQTGPLPTAPLQSGLGGVPAHIGLALGTQPVAGPSARSAGAHWGPPSAHDRQTAGPPSTLANLHYPAPSHGAASHPRHQAAVGAGQNVTGTLTAGNSFVSASKSVTADIPSDVREKIWNNQYVSLGALLGQQERASKAKGTVADPEEPTTLLAWSRAWNRFVAVLSQQHGNRLTVSLAQHFEVVHCIAEKNGNWSFYDQEFRKMIGRGEADWGSTHLELFIHALLVHKQEGAQDKADQAGAKQLQVLPFGACRTWHRSGSCSQGDSCVYQHACFNSGCKGFHPIFRCPLPVRPPFHIQDRFKGKKGQQVNNLPFQAGPADNSGQPVRQDDRGYPHFPQRYNRREGMQPTYTG